MVAKPFNLARSDFSWKNYHTTFVSTTFNVVIDESALRNFFRALDDYADYRVEKDGKSYHYALNRTAQNVAGWAAHYTHHADYNQLRAMLDQAERKVSPKTGRPMKVRATATTAAGRVLAARMIKAGKNPRAYDRDKWREKVRLFVGRTLRSINFMRSGWLPAYQELTLRVHQSAEVDRFMAFGRRQVDERGQYGKYAYSDIGGAAAAHAAYSGLMAELWNRAVNPRNGTSWTQGLGKYGRMGLDRALVFKAHDMYVYIEQEERRRARELGFT